MCVRCSPKRGSREPHKELDRLHRQGFAIGRPRSGWGPEMEPFGHSIPGEPFVLVDGYRDSVRREAATMGIPLREQSPPRNAESSPRRVR